MRNGYKTYCSNSLKKYPWIFNYKLASKCYVSFLRFFARCSFLFLYRPVDMKRIWGDYELWNIVGHHGWPTKNFFHSKSPKTARKTNICRRQVMQISIINRCLLRNSLESDLKVSKFLMFFEVWSLDWKS